MVTSFLRHRPWLLVCLSRLLMVWLSPHRVRRGWQVSVVRAVLCPSSW